MKSLEATRRKLRREFNQKQNVSDCMTALMGQGNGTVEVPNMPGYVYYRSSDESDYGIVFNNRCPVRDDLRIYVGYDPVTDKDRSLFQVLSIDMGDYAGDGGSTPLPNVPHHHDLHEFGGGDDVYVEWRRLMGLRVGRPALFVVTVDPGALIIDDAYQYIPSTNVDLTAEHAALAGTQACYVLIYIDSAGVIQHLAGVPVASIAVLGIDDCPIPPTAGDFALAAVRLYVAQTRIGDTPTNPDIWDLRFPASATWSSGNNWSLIGNAGTVAVTNYLGTNDAVDVVFATNAVERMRLSHADLALIIGDTAHGTGAAGANTRLFTVGAGTAASQCVIIYGTGNPTHAGYKSQGTRAVPVVCNANDYLARFTGRGYCAGAWPGAANASVDLLADEIFTTTSGTRIELCTTPTGDTTRAVHAVVRRGDFRVQYDAANYVAITPGAACGVLSWTPEISGTVIVRSATPNIVGGAFGATPGNARGTNAVDLQLHRFAATSVASGADSYIIGGYDNTASGDYSGVIGGTYNVASGASSLVLSGNENVASGNTAVVIGGNKNVAAALYSVAGGRRSIVAAAHTGVFLFADGTDADFNSYIAGEAAFRVRGGFRVAYDDSNWARLLVSAAGVGTFTTLPVGAGYVFTPPVTFTAAPICSTLTAGRVVFAGASKELVGDADLTFSGTRLTATDLTVTNAPIVSSLTASHILYAGASKEIVGSANATLDSSGNGTFKGGFNVGTASGATAGQVRSSGALLPGGHATYGYMTQTVAGLADDDTVQLSAQAQFFGFAMILCTSEGNAGIYVGQGGLHTTQEVSDPSTVFANSDLDTFHCVYWDGAKYVLKNRRGSAKNYTIHLIGYV